MSVQEDIVRLRQEVVGAEQLDRLAKQYAQHEEAVRKLAKAYLDGSISQAQFEAMSAHHAGSMQRLGRETDRLNRSVGGLGASGKNSAMGLLLLGQAVDDAQYGFRAIVNNIPGIVMSLGGSAGLAGAASIAAVAINQLAQQKDTIVELWNSFDGAKAAGKTIESTFTDLRDQAYSAMNAISGGLFHFDAAGDALTQAATTRAKKEADDKKKALKDITGVMAADGNEDWGRAVGEALKKTGGNEALDELVNKQAAMNKRLRGNSEEAIKARETLRQNYAKLIADAKAGSKAAQTTLGDLVLDTAFGAAIDKAAWAKPLREQQEELKKAAAEQKAEAERLNAEGQKLEDEFKTGMVRDASKGVTDTMKEGLEGLADQLKMKGADFKGSVASMKPRIKAALVTQNPALAAFPELLDNAAKDLAAGIVESVDASFAKLAELEGLTNAEIARRRAALRRSAQEDAAKKLAAENFAHGLANEEQRNRPFNPRGPRSTVEQRNQVGANLQEQLARMGLSPAEQVAVSKIYANRRTSQHADSVLAMLNEATGGDQAEALRWLPQVFAGLRNGGNVFAQTQRVQNRILQGDRAAVNNAVNAVEQPTGAAINPEAGVDPNLMPGNEAGINADGQAVPGQPRRRGRGFQSVGVEGPSGNAAEAGVNLNRQAYQASAKAVEVSGKILQQVGPLAAAWPRLVQRLNQLDRQAESFTTYKRSASMIER